MKPAETIAAGIAAAAFGIAAAFGVRTLRRRQPGGGQGGAAPPPQAGDRTAPATIIGIPTQQVNAEAVQDLAARLRRVGPEVAGHQLSPTEIATVLSIAGTETGFCRWKLGGKIGNCGSIQCLIKERTTAPPWLDCTTEAEDQHFDGQKYTTFFAGYKDAPGPDGTMRPAADWAAYHLLRHLYVHRPNTGAALTRGADLWTVLDRLHREKYYEGFSKPNPDPVSNYTAAAYSRIPGILAALSLPADTVKLGTRIAT